MERRTLLRNLLSSVVAVPMIGAFQTRAIASAETDDETHMRRAIRLAGNEPKYPFAAVLVDQEKRKGEVKSSLRPLLSLRLCVKRLSTPTT